MKGDSEFSESKAKVIKRIIIKNNYSTSKIRYSKIGDIS
jgi:hypothetical protein